MVALRILCLVSCIRAVASPAAVAADPVIAPWHATLTRSVPAANDTLRSSPTTVKLWFSERVELDVSRIRLVGTKGQSFVLGKVAPIVGEGHAVRGEYSFVITPEKPRR